MKYNVMTLVGVASLVLAVGFPLQATADKETPASKDKPILKPRLKRPVRPSPAPAPTENEFVYVTMTTSKGPVLLELNKAKAPISTANFVAYAEAGTYDGTIFHRVIPGMS